MAGMAKFWADLVESQSDTLEKKSKSGTVLCVRKDSSNICKKSVSKLDLSMSEQDILDQILQKNLSYINDTGMADQSLDEPCQISYQHLLEGKIIDVAAERQASQQARRLQEELRRKRRRVQSAPLVCRCSAKQILQELDPQPRCRWYEAWMHRKRVLQEKAFNNVCLEDLKYIHRTCRPGDVYVPLQWNKIAKRGCQHRTQNLRLLEQVLSSDRGPFVGKRW